MDNEVDVIVSELKQTDSQKSVSTSNGCSLASTDDTSEKFNSSGRDTYVLDWDSESDSSIEESKSTISLKETPRSLISKNIQCEAIINVNRASSISRSVFAQETYTQTSKTIIELAETDKALKIPVHNSTLETQTSLISITESRTVEYRIEVSGNNIISKNELVGFNNGFDKFVSDHNMPSCISNTTVNFPSESMMLMNTEPEKAENICSSNSFTDKNVGLIADGGSKETSELELSLDDTDLEDDSLKSPTIQNLNRWEDQSECITPKSVDNEISELYNKLYECMDLESYSSNEPAMKHCGHLTPLSEETTVKKESIETIKPTNNVVSTKEDNEVLFTVNSGMKVKLFPHHDNFKLPPIHNNGPTLDFLFDTSKPNRIVQAGKITYEEIKERPKDRWEIGTKELASGESPLITVRSVDRERLDTLQLPPIKVEGYVMSRIKKTEYDTNNILKAGAVTPLVPSAISIKEKIKELKMIHRNNLSSKPSQNTESRSVSPSTNYPDENRLSETQEKGCDILITDLLKRLRSQAWYEITETLEDVPRLLEKFWHCISEQRVADLLRTVSAQVESPRTQVSRAACQTLAAILKNTNYTKKPDFYEAVTVLLIKTGSFSRPVRRAANIALDDIVCGVDLIHIITALCIHGSSHKSALVRCASARLLVVCCALGGGGRELLRARPPSAAAARKHALQALAALLEDKSTETRKYAERLYSMLRPLSNFEAYFLTDVDVDLASRQMKKYDQIVVRAS